MRRVWVLVAVVVVAGCSGGTHEALTKHEALTSIPASAVLGLQDHPVPEGPQPPPITPADPVWSRVKDVLPDPLPEPLSQPSGCGAGHLTILTVKDHAPIEYGPCRFPASITRLTCAVFGEPCDETRGSTLSILEAADRAKNLCRGTVPHPERLVSSDPTTVGTIRHTTIGTPAPTPGTQFTSLKTGDFAAWCWTRDGATFHIYRAAAGQHAALVASETGINPESAHGAPMIP